MLDDEDQRALLSADLSFSRNVQGTILIDEWQKLPQVWGLFTVERGALVGGGSCGVGVSA